MNKLIGSICALATPFRDDAVDLDAWGRLIEFQIASGTQGLIVAGSTGEAHALVQPELDRLLEVAVERVAGRVPVIAGTGTANTRKTIAATLRAKSLGADAALVVTPYYVRPTQDGLVRHYSEIAEHGGLPVVLYNVPSRTGCDLLPETVARLVANAGIAGVKEAVADSARMDALVALKNPQFSVLSGDDPTCVRAMLNGADGVISVAANVVPAAFRALCDAARTRDFATAQLSDANLAPLYELLFVEPNPTPVKWMLHSLGFGSPDLRLPLLPLSPAWHERARQVLAAVAVQPRHSNAA